MKSYRRIKVGKIDTLEYWEDIGLKEDYEIFAGLYLFKRKKECYVMELLSLNRYRLIWKTKNEREVIRR